MLTKLKRKFIMPFSNYKRKKILYNNIMTPEEIRNEEKKYHELMLMANQQGKDKEQIEFMHKRDVLRKVLRMNV